MKGYKDQEFKEMRNKFLLGLLVAIVLIALFVVIILRRFGVGSTINSNIRKDKTFTVLVVNKDCSKCDDIKKYLDDNKVKYEELDEYSAEGRSLLANYEFVTDTSVSPAVIYIKKGKMYANLVNGNTTDELELFIKNYKLNK